ncbi:MAG TPA: DUF5808 domain-containing protein [Dehalococcoidia bacterium]|nr:DUF5808 domain-containing protein [Dehalococcoidia bacterium]
MIQKLKKAFFWLSVGLAIAAVLDQLQRPAMERTWYGAVFGVPYDFRRPSIERMRRSWWNPDDPHLFTPRSFGVGWDVNLHRLLQLAMGANRDAGAPGSSP